MATREDHREDAQRIHAQLHQIYRQPRDHEEYRR